jgi:hypothetical protein
VTSAPVPSGPSAALSATRPSADFPVTDPGTTVIRLHVVAIANPSLQGLTLLVTLDGVDVGAVALHPPDQPADYVLGLPPDAVARVHTGQAAARVTLAALGAGEPVRSDVALTVQLT